MDRIRAMLRYILLALCLASLANAQIDQAQIAGTVRDSSDALVPAAKVRATNLSTDLSRNTETGANGHYILTNLPVGMYRIEVEASGFKRFIKTNVTLDAASRTSIDAVLELGLVTESISVSASSAQVQSETAQIGRVIESRQISDLALNGRNPINLALMKAGVVGGNFNVFNPEASIVKPVCGNFFQMIHISRGELVFDSG